jgi:hypothetical protein
MLIIEFPAYDVSFPLPPERPFLLSQLIPKDIRSPFTMDIRCTACGAVEHSGSAIKPDAIAAGIEDAFFIEQHLLCESPVR